MEKFFLFIFSLFIFLLLMGCNPQTTNKIRHLSTLNPSSPSWNVEIENSSIPEQSQIFMDSIFGMKVVSNVKIAEAEEDFRMLYLPFDVWDDMAESFMFEQRGEENCSICDYDVYR